MTKSEILNDLNYVKSMAEEGKHAPMLGGRIGLWWGILLCIALLAHWAALKGIGPITIEAIGFVWMCFGVVGGIGTVILGRSLAGKPGASSVNNRVAEALWIGVAAMLFVYSVSAFFSAALGKVDFIIMDTIMPVAFGLYAITAGVIARVSNDKWQSIPGFIALAFVPICLLLIGTPELYLMAILGVILTSIIPSIIELRNEPKTVV